MPDFLATAARPAAKWWQRLQAQAEIEWRLTPGDLTVKEWLLSFETARQHRYRGYRVVWLRAWLRVLGVRFGAAVFYRGEVLDA